MIKVKLNRSFVTHTVDGEQIMVAVGGDVFFHGMVRSNKTAAMIIDLLKNETSEKMIVEALHARFNAPKERIAQDVAAVLDQLRSIGALDE